MHVQVSGSVETGFDTNIRISQGETLPIDISFDDAGVPTNLVGYSIFMRINSPAPFDFIIENGGIRIIDALTGKIQINLAILPPDFSAGIFPYDLWTILGEDRMQVLSGYFEVVKKQTPL